jgi:alpha-methylacyl-CoA racemase
LVSDLSTRSSEIITRVVPLKSHQRNITPANQNERQYYPLVKEYFTAAFLTKSRDEWTDILCHDDTCVAPVLDYKEAAAELTSTAPGDTSTATQLPAPAPHLSRTPAKNAADAYPELGHKTMILPPGKDSQDILKDIGFSSGDIQKLFQEGNVEQFGQGRVQSKL